MRSCLYWKMRSRSAYGTRSPTRCSPTFNWGVLLMAHLRPMTSGALAWRYSQPVAGVEAMAYIVASSPTCLIDSVASVDCLL